MWGISILADFRRVLFHAAVVFGLGKDFLFKSILRHYVYEVEFSLKIFFIILRTVVLFIGWTLLARHKYEKNVISPS